MILSLSVEVCMAYPLLTTYWRMVREKTYLTRFCCWNNTRLVINGEVVMVHQGGTKITIVILFLKLWHKDALRSTGQKCRKPFQHNFSIQVCFLMLTKHNLLKNKNHKEHSTKKLSQSMWIQLKFNKNILFFLVLKECKKLSISQILRLFLQKNTS